MPRALAALALLAALAATAGAAERQAPAWSPLRPARNVKPAQYQREARAPARRPVRSAPVHDPFVDPFAEPAPGPIRQAPRSAPPRGRPSRIVSEPLLAQPLEDDRPPNPAGQPQPLPPSDGDEAPCPPLDSLKDIDAISLSIKPDEDPPAECTLDGEPFYVRCWADKCYTWKASALCSKPLYFEDERFERYGMMRRPLLQPVVSGARFFGSAALLPYKMGVEHPTECIYALGHFRPGSCVPRFRYRLFPLDPEGTLYQAAAVTGAILLIP